MEEKLGNNNKMTVRPYRFHLEEQLLQDWHGGSAFKTAFFNALSLQFPEGEKQFIHSVRLFREEIENPALRSEVKDFIGQEAMHGREHLAYNEALKGRGYDIDGLLGPFFKRMSFLKTLPRRMQLAGTCGAEHVTAVLAHGLLTHPDWLKGVEPEMRSIWQWHALEETEHKSVVFDVYRERVGDERLRRIIFLYVLWDFFIVTLRNLLYFLRRDKQLWRLSTWRDAVRFLWSREGVLRRSMPLLLRYFRKGFHPAQHKNERVVEHWQTVFGPEHPPAPVGV